MGNFYSLFWSFVLVLAIYVSYSIKQAVICHHLSSLLWRQIKRLMIELKATLKFHMRNKQLLPALNNIIKTGQKTLRDLLMMRVFNPLNTFVCQRWTNPWPHLATNHLNACTFSLSIPPIVAHFSLSTFLSHCCRYERGNVIMILRKQIVIWRKPSRN